MFIPKIRKQGNGSIYVPLTYEENELAMDHALDVGILKNSITQGVGNLTGTVGELAFLKLFPHAQDSDEITYDYDFIMDNKKWELKTKYRTVKVQLDFDATVYDFNTTQQADYYVFISAYFDERKGYFTYAEIIGYISPEEYYKQSTLYKKDELDPKSNIGWRFKADSHNLEYSLLTKFHI